MTDAKGQVTNYQYAADDDLKQINYTNAAGQPLSPPTPTVNYTYEIVYNRPATMSDATGITNYAYNTVASPPTLGSGRLLSIDGPLTNDTITYSYDELGRTTSSAINGVPTSSTFDALGRVLGVDNVLGHFTPAYDGPTSRLHSFTAPNGQVTTYSYLDVLHDKHLQTAETVAAGATNAAKFDYTYDTESEILSWAKQIGRSGVVTSTYTNDLADQLTNVSDATSGGGTITTSYGYDFGGNRTSDSTGSYTVNDTNEITNGGYAYDLNGNMTSDGVRSYEWDAANKLTGIIYPGNGGRSQFTYDGLNRRVLLVEKDGSGTVQRTSKFVWNGEAIAEERSSTDAVVKRFLPQGVQVLGNAAPNSKLYYSRDHLGSVRTLTNETGTLLSTLDYDAYGSLSRAAVPVNASSGGPVITNAVSRLTHGSAGTFDLPLPLAGAPAIEMRSGNGGLYTLVMTFDRNVVSGSAAIASGIGSAGAPTFSGTTATVQLSSVTSRQTVTLELDNVSDGTVATSKVFVAVSFLVGDVNQDGVVNAQDISLVKSKSGAAVSATTFKYDTNADGSINSADISQTKAAQDGSLLPDFAYTGHYYHARSGLYLTHYRVYSPTIGRWLSRDPIGEVGSVNLYEYARNAPADLWDPLGLKVYDNLETQTILRGAYNDATAGLLQGLLNIYNNSGTAGKYDFKLTKKDDIFCLDGQPLSAPEFGNFVAGFSGRAYDQTYFSAFTPFAGLGVRAAGFIYHNFDSDDRLNRTGLPFINAGDAYATSFPERH